MPTGPFSNAMQLRGSDVILDLYEHPDECRRFIDLCARVQVEVVRNVRLVSGEPLDQHVTNFGISARGCAWVMIAW